MPRKTYSLRLIVSTPRCLTLICAYLRTSASKGFNHEIFNFVAVSAILIMISFVSSPNLYAQENAVNIDESLKPVRQETTLSSSKETQDRNLAPVPHKPLTETIVSPDPEPIISLDPEAIASPDPEPTVALDPETEIEFIDLMPSATEPVAPTTIQPTAEPIISMEPESDIRSSDIVPPPQEPAMAVIPPQAAVEPVFSPVAEPICPEPKPCPTCPEPKPCPTCPEPVTCASINSSTIALDSQKKEYAMDNLRFFMIEYERIIESKKIDKNLALSFLSDIDHYLASYRDIEGAEQVLLIKAHVLNKIKEYEHALLTYFKLVFEYPESRFIKEAEIAYRGLLMGKLKKNNLESLELTKGDSAEEWPKRQAHFILLLSSLDGKKYTQLIIDEALEFLERYPNYALAADVLSQVPELYLRDKRYRSAALELTRLILLYPESTYRVASLAELARVYQEVKEYQRAAESYIQLYNEYPETDEALMAHEMVADLYEEKLKDITSAIDMHELIVTKYENYPAASEALLEIGRLKEKEKDYAGAIDAYIRFADMFKGDPSVVEQLEDAAALAEKKLKDYDLKIKIQLKLVDEYPSFEEAVEALYDVAKTYYKKLDDVNQAKKYYEKVISQYPGHNLAAAAEKRINKIMGL